MYDSSFYDMINDGSMKSAEVIVPKVMKLFSPKRVVDVGCGEGAWLRVFQSHGCEVKGLDGAYVDRSRLLIDDADFTAADLSDFSVVGSRFDLAVSLEVAEHLPEASAADFVHSLCSLAPVVLFSAAAPGQGGVAHINEQWPAYWVEKFAKEGYISSGALRWEVWDDPDVEPWYAQNLLICTELGRAVKLMKTDSPPRHVIHPTVWEHHRG